MKLFRNFLSLAGAEAVSKLLTFAAFASLARIVGPENFGYVEWAGAVLLCAGLIVDQGFGSYGAREIAKDTAKARGLIAEIIGARLILAIAAYVIVALLAFGLHRADILSSLLLLYGVSLFAAPLMLSWVFQGFEKMHTVAVIQLIRQTIFAVVVLVFVRSSDQLLMVAMAEILAVSISAMVSVWAVKTKLSLPVGINFKFSSHLFREGVPIGLSQMLWVVKMFGATLIVGLIATAADTGYFAGAMRIFIALHTFVWLYYFNLLPSMARSWTAGQGEFSMLILRSMRIVVLLSVIGGIVWVVSSPLVMTTVFGQDFLPGAGALQWLAGACVAAAISGHYRFGLIAAGFQKQEMFTAAVGAAAAAVLIPVGYFNAGTSGAAAALCFAEIAVLSISWLISRRTLFGNEGDSQPFEAMPEPTQ
jgi:O-antigen/teichoic acid export membrane protein